MRTSAKEGAVQQASDHPNSVSSSSTKATGKEDTAAGSAAAPVTAVERPPGTECWVHEACLLWAPGIYVSNSKLCGLEETVILAQDSVSIILLFYLFFMSCFYRELPYTADLNQGQVGYLKQEHHVKSHLKLMILEILRSMAHLC